MFQINVNEIEFNYMFFWKIISFLGHNNFKFIKLNLCDLHLYLINTHKNAVENNDMQIKLQEFVVFIAYAKAYSVFYQLSKILKWIINLRQSFIHFQKWNKNGNL